VPDTKSFKKEVGSKMEARIRPIGKDEQIPPMPGLFYSLTIMSGCMEKKVVPVSKAAKDFDKRFNAVRPKIQELLDKDMRIKDISKTLSMRYSTASDYIKKIRAAA
jgi:hypothetical protein